MSTQDAYQARLMAGMSADELSRAAGVSAATLARYEAQPALMTPGVWLRIEAATQYEQRINGVLPDHYNTDSKSYSPVAHAGGGVPSGANTGVPMLGYLLTDWTAPDGRLFAKGSIFSVADRNKYAEPIYLTHGKYARPVVDDLIG